MRMKKAVVKPVVKKAVKVQATKPEKVTADVLVKDVLSKAEQLAAAHEETVRAMAVQIKDLRAEVVKLRKALGSV